jgi:predicted nucleotidyltransferase
MPFVKPAHGPAPAPIAKSPFDVLQQARLEAHLAVLRPQVEQALAKLASIGVAAWVVGSFARANANGRFRPGSDVDFLIESRGAASMGDIFEAIASSVRSAPFDIVYWDTLSSSGRQIMLESNPELDSLAMAHVPTSATR